MQLSKRQIQKENTRKRIIETAYRVYSEKGFSASTNLIAKEAEISHGSIFTHFPTLNDLLIGLISDFGEKINLRLHVLAKRCDCIEDLLNEHLRVIEEYEAFYVRLISEISLLPNEAKSTFVTIQSTVAFHFSKVIEHEIETGNVKSIPTHMLFNTWLGLIHYYLLNKEFFVAQDLSVLDRHQAELIDTYLNLIKIEM